MGPRRSGENTKREQGETRCSKKEKVDKRIVQASEGWNRMVVASRGISRHQEIPSAPICWVLRKGTQAEDRCPAYHSRIFQQEQRWENKLFRKSLSIFYRRFPPSDMCFLNLFPSFFDITISQLIRSNSRAVFFRPHTKLFFPLDLPFYPQAAGSTFLRNFIKFLQNYTAPYSRISFFAQIHDQVIFPFFFSFGYFSTQYQFM